MRSIQQNDIVGRRNGLTATELVVLVGVLGLVLILAIGSLHDSRQPVRSLMCLNNMRNVGLALHNYATNYNGHLPPLVGDKGAWPVELLPYLDQQALYDNYQKSEELGLGKPGEYQLDFLVCPEDEINADQPGGLSFVVNAGYGDFVFDQANEWIKPGATGLHDGTNIDWDRDGEMGSDEDFAIARATGVFWPPSERGASLSLVEINAGDGQSQTLLLSENLNAGAARNWASPDLLNHAFVVGAGIDPKSKQSRHFGSQSGPLTIRSDADFSRFLINSDLGNRRGHWPAPSSRHPGKVNAIMADGRGTSLNEKIDPEVYIRLISPAGEQYGQASVTDDEF